MARKIVFLFGKESPSARTPFISLEVSTARWRALVWSALLGWLRSVDEGVERDLRTLVETGASEKDALSVLTSTGVTVQGSYLGDHRARTRLQHWRWGRDPRAEEVEEMADAVSSVLFNEVDADKLDLEELDELFGRALPCLSKLEPPPPQGGVQAPLALPRQYSAGGAAFSSEITEEGVR